MMQIKRIAIEKLRSNGYNPDSRITDDALHDLEASIKRVGIVQPLLALPDGQLVDGHRRLECAKRLGLTDVPVIFVDADHFVEVNSTQRRTTGREWLTVYMATQQAPSRTLRSIKQLERIGGKPLLEYLMRCDLAPSIINTARYVARYIGSDVDNDAVMHRIIMWLAEGRRQFSAKRAIAEGIPAKILYKHIQQGSDPMVLWE